jgi:hypothetical protein
MTSLDHKPRARPPYYRRFVWGLRIFAYTWLLTLADVVIVGMVFRSNVAYYTGLVLILTGFIAWFVGVVGYIGMLRSPLTPTMSITNPRWRTYVREATREAFLGRPRRSR